MTLFRVDPDKSFDGPHQKEDVFTGGLDLKSASGAMVMVHGRGASAEGILSLAGSFETRALHYVAPSAAGNTWYPYSFLYPMEQNQPWLNSAIQVVHNRVSELEKAGIPKERIILLGFSQGACLVSEYAARHPGLFGGLVCLSGGLIGDIVEPDDYSGSMKKTPVFIGCSDIDPHIPLKRVNLTAGVFRKLGADVNKQIYPGMGHTVNEDEIDHINAMIKRVTEMDG